MYMCVCACRYFLQEGSSLSLDWLKGKSRVNHGFPHEI